MDSLHTGGHGLDDNKQIYMLIELVLKIKGLLFGLCRSECATRSLYTRISPTASQLEPRIKHKYIEAKISRQLKARLTFHLPSLVVCRVGGAAKYPRHIFNR